MPSRTRMRNLEDFEMPRIVPLTDDLFGASFFLMKLLPARFMLERAAEQGLLKPGATICETSSGTFGLALAMLAVQHGYKLILVSDQAIDRHLHQRLLALGARVDIVEKPHPTGGFQQARLDRLEGYLREIPDSYWPSQYANPDNPLSYAKVAERLIDRIGRIDCLVGAVGSGGSMCGTARYLRVLFPELHVIGVDSHNSVLFGQPNGERLLRGLGGSIIPENVDHTQFDEVHWLTAAEAFRSTHLLHRRHGLFLGPTSGAAYKVARWWSRLNPGKRTVVLFPDEGHRYVETVYDEVWLQGAVPGWHAAHLATPATIRVPNQAVGSWSRLAWCRRTLEQVLAGILSANTDHSSLSVAG